LYFSRILSLPSGGILNPAAIVSFELFNFDSEHIRKILVFASAEFLGAIIAAGIFKGIYLP
jgi:glycerol uptake facilitator-like aquaporin